MESKSDCSNLFSFREIEFFMIFSFFCQENLDIKKLTEFQFLNPIVGCCQGIFRGCKSGVQE